MRTHALMVILFGAIALLVAALAPPGGAAAQPQPTLVLSPSSGPCDAPVEVKGHGFPVGGGHPTNPLVYLLRPGTTDVNMGFLTYGSVDRDGSFSQWFGLRQHGCEAAALDGQADQPSGHLVIAVTLFQPTLQPGARIPDIIATAQYEYTTTAPHVPTETLSVLPPSGPCDATVEVTGSGFEPGMEVVLKLASASGEFGLGPLASAAAGDDGGIEAHFSFGELGCSTAELITQYGSRGELVVGAFPAVYPTPRPPGPPDPLAAVRYTFTTTTPAAGPLPRTLPATGSGPGRPSARVAWAPLIGAVAALGVIFMAASLCGRRLRS